MSFIGRREVTLSSDIVGSVYGSSVKNIEYVIRKWNIELAAIRVVSPTSQIVAEPKH